MRLFDAILDANHRAIAGDDSAGVRESRSRWRIPLRTGILESVYESLRSNS
jgi:hypothetical protein